jgi:hypothetical protein
MNRTLPYAMALLLTLLLISTVVVSAQEPQSTPASVNDPQLIEALIGYNFSFQGRLQDNGSPANGAFDMQFRLYNEPTGGVQVGPLLTRNDVDVVNGLFTIRLDFGDVFDGTALYLEIEVRRGSSTGAYTLLTPRQPLTPTPYAQYARSASNVFAQTNSSGTPTGDGFRLRFDSDLFGWPGDALVIEKTDSFSTAPDGGVAFVNTGGDGVGDVAMVVRGNGDVGVGVLDLAYRLSVRMSSNRLAITRGPTTPTKHGASARNFRRAARRFLGERRGRTAVDRRGNVGIGVLDPVTKLHVEGAVNESVVRVSDPNYARINMVASNPAPLNNVHMFIGARGTGFTGADIGELGTISDHDLLFFTKGVARMRITNTGDICIGAC